MSLLKKLEQALPSLEMLIEAHINVSVKGRLSVTEEVSRNGEVSYRIQSGSLRDLLNPLTAAIFKDIIFYFWGGNLNSEGTRVWFLPKVSYDHQFGGSNGCDVIWRTLLFDIETGHWITREN